MVFDLTILFLCCVLEQKENDVVVEDVKDGEDDDDVDDDDEDDNVDGNLFN